MSAIGTWTVAPCELRPGDVLPDFFGNVVDQVVERRNPLTGKQMWTVYRSDGRAEATFYAQDRVTVVRCGGL